MDQNSRYIESAIGDDGALWDLSLCRQLAGLVIPEVILGDNKELLKGDVNRLWAGWFIDSFVSKDYMSLKHSYMRIFKDIYEKFSSERVYADEKELLEFSKLLAGYVEKRVKYFNEKAARKRLVISSEVKTYIEGMLSISPRCWYTGYRFPEESIDRFLNGGRHKSKPLRYIDSSFPLGRFEGDLNIEIDHLLPFSKGGDDSIENFKPVCSLVNKFKGNNCIYYDTAGVPSTANDSQYYWIVRSLALKRKCEYFGCKKNLDNERLYACGKYGGMLNPLSIKIFCSEHDTNAPTRFTKNLNL